MMQFWDENSGAVQLSEDTRLYSHMPRQELLKAYASLGEKPTAGYAAEGESILPFPSFGVPGGRLACVCVLHGNALHAIEFNVVTVGQKKRGTAEQQRALLFACLRGADPAKDSKRGVLLRCPFGTALVATDPHTGDALLRLTYR